MRNIEILKGKVNDAVTTYFLSMNSEYVYMANEVLQDDPCMANIKIILKSDSGCYPGTPQELNTNNYNYVLDELLELGIIAKCKNVDGCPGYCRGEKYNA